MSSGSSSRQAVSGADGAFQVKAVHEGRSRVEAEKEGYAPARPGVEVQVADGPGASGGGVSDPEGRFEVDGLEAGTYEVLVLRKGDGPIRQVVELRSDRDIVLDLTAAPPNGL